MRRPTPRHAVLLALVAALLAGCGTVPSTDIQIPLTARPPVDDKSGFNNGGIFRPSRGLAIFEDRRARFVGDNLTVNLVERGSATRKSETKESRAASAEVNVPTPMVLGKTPSALGETVWNPESSSTQNFSDNDTNSNTITGTVTVTVVEVLENGNLVVAGEKRISVNNDTEYIRLAGVVNPMYISASNTIDSTRLADAKIESKNAQGLDAAQVTSIFARFFLTLVPF
ncbi:MAG: flagellar basal body L-ring protein FlgH [Thiobacillaceae bacterium]|nr:flagellar basal body L-ring protein FlgH [Thiobacillaceae bacterium]